MTLQPRQLPGCTVELILIELLGKASKAAPWSGASRSDQVALLGHAQALIPAHRQPTSASVLDLSLKLTKGFAVRCVHLDLTSIACLPVLCLSIPRDKPLTETTGYDYPMGYAYSQTDLTDLYKRTGIRQPVEQFSGNPVLL